MRTDPHRTDLHALGIDEFHDVHAVGIETIRQSAVDLGLGSAACIRGCQAKAILEVGLRGGKVLVTPGSKAFQWYLAKRHSHGQEFRTRRQRSE